MATQSEETSSSQDAMRTRVRLFAEGVVKMVSPVLLALALRKVDLKGEGTLFVFVRGIISPMAAVTMAFGILLMVLLWLCLSKIFARTEWLQDAASKLLVHICAVLLMCLAYFILLLISMDYKVYIAMVLPLVGFVMYCYVCRLLEGDNDRADEVRAQAAYDRELESSMDFFAAFTVLLFLGLERLALEVHLNSLHPHDHLESSLALSFITCLLGVAIMFVWTVPPSLSNDEINAMRGCIEASNVVLAVLISFTVVWITWAPLNVSALWVIVPPFVSFLFGVFVHLIEAVPDDDHNRINPPQGSDDVVDIEMDKQQQSDQPDPETQPPQSQDDRDIGDQSRDNNDTTSLLPPNDSKVKPPPPLELMKFAFAGFLAVSIPSIRDCSLISIWTHAFILFTAISLVSALLWRLLSHRAETSRLLVVAANFASLFTHVFAVASLVPFAVMADMNARLIVPDCRN